MQALLLDAPLTAVAVKFRATGKMVFALLEQRQYVLPGPAGVALRSPTVVIPGLAAHINHTVDGGAAA